MCNCINTIEENSLSHFRDIGKFKAEVQRVKIKEIGFPISNGDIQCRTTSTLVIELEGAAKSKTQVLMHRFCPFCGQPYDQPDRAETSRAQLPAGDAAL